MPANPSSFTTRARRVSPSANSNAALNMLMIQYGKTLGAGFKVWSIDPELLATNFVDAEVVRKLGGFEPEVGGKLFTSVVRGERDEDIVKMIAGMRFCRDRVDRRAIRRLRMMEAKRSVSPVRV